MSTARPAVPAEVDTRPMILLHRCMRQELRLAPGAVRRIAPADAPSTRLVADHLDFLVAFVRHHHEIEDDLLWPVLRARLADEPLATVALMESQHEALSTALARVEGAVVAWRHTAGATERDHLAGVLDELYPLVIEHLDAEEQRLLPIAVRTMEPSEWDRIGEEGYRRSPRRHRSLALGMFDHYGDPEVVETMVAPIPRPIRRLVLSGARRTFRQRARQVHGTPTP
jgi:hemerythrin-like domain-containing protein